MLGLLLHGQPGTGKTSTIKAIANMTQRHIITVSLESIKTKRQLKALFHDERLHVENTENREGFETYRIPINKRLYVLEVRLQITPLEATRRFAPTVAGMTNPDSVHPVLLPSSC